MERDVAKHQIDIAWWEATRSLPKHQLSEEHDRREQWNWVQNLGQLRKEVGHRGYGWALSYQPKVQGAILYAIGQESELDPNEPTLMIYRVATAPWNRRSLFNPRQFSGVGTGLVRLAIWHSYRYGFGGRITVEAYDDPSILDWYIFLGFVEVTVDHDGIHTLELTLECATAQLKIIQTKS